VMLKSRVLFDVIEVLGKFRKMLGFNSGFFLCNLLVG
jgi:hypothetical protein